MTTKQFVHRATLLGVAATLLLTANLARAQDEGRVDRLRTEAKKLMEQAKERKAAGAHEEAGRLAEEAERLVREANQLVKQHGERERPDKAEYRERAEKRERVQAEIKRLEADGKLEEAERLKQRLGELDAPKQRDPRSAELAELKERHARLTDEIAALRKDGRHDEAARQEQEARHIRERLELADQGREPKRAFQPAVPEAEQAHRKLEHLRAAAENLRAAGVHDAAESIAQQARQIERELHARAVQPREGHAEAPPFARELHEQIGALRHEVGELRRQLEELRRQKR